MNTEDFLQRPRVRTAEWSQALIDAKAWTDDLVFDCRFNGNGCRRGVVAICCEDCSNGVGYFREGFPPDKIDFYAGLFNETDGFLTPNGCVLDRVDRSFACLITVCEPWILIGNTKEVVRKWNDLMRTNINKIDGV